jgi:hypothetical protein
VSRRSQHLLPVGAVLDLGHHPRADLETGDLRTNRPHDPRDLLARAKWWLGQYLVAALDDHQVGKVDADGAGLDQDFLRSRLGGRHLFDNHLFGGTKLVDDHRAHTNASPSRVARSLPQA